MICIMLPIPLEYMADHMNSFAIVTRKICPPLYYVDINLPLHVDPINVAPINVRAEGTGARAPNFHSS